MFFAAIEETLLEVTIPHSNIAKPGAMNITKNPQTKNNNVLKTYLVSGLIVLSAEKLGSTNKIKANNEDKTPKVTFFISILLKICFP